MIIIQLSNEQLYELVDLCVEKALSRHNKVEVPEQPEQLLTVQQAALFMNLSVATIYTKVSRGELPVMKRGKRLYFSTKELVAYLKDGRKKSNADIELEANAYLARHKNIKKNLKPPF
jgi:excisionase family DNA binding protein